MARDVGALGSRRSSQQHTHIVTDRRRLIIRVRELQLRSILEDIRLFFYIRVCVLVVCYPS